MSGKEVCDSNDFILQTLGNLQRENKEKVRVTRCKDCTHFTSYDGKCWSPKFHITRGTFVEPDGYCAWGEPREP